MNRSAEVEDLFRTAYLVRDVAIFLDLMFPPEWSGILARIVESGAEFSTGMCPWAPRWSPIPPTVRRGKTELATHVKSCMFRVHDCIHQLWGLPIPRGFTTDDFYLYKRAQMCGEVAVLTLTEFCFADHLFRRFAGHPGVAETLLRRNAIPMLEGPLSGKTPLQIALRMDDLLHKKSRPRWVREHAPSTAFVDDYVPMLEFDRRDIDHNWALMKAANWKPEGAPNARYSVDLDGLELTSWMIEDFFHLRATDAVVDTALRDFNRERRRRIQLPDGWGLKETV